MENQWLLAGQPPTPHTDWHGQDMKAQVSHETLCILVGVGSVGRLSVPYAMAIRKVMEGTRNFVVLIDEPITKQAARHVQSYCAVIGCHR